MAWVKIDEKFYDHPKWASAPGDSIALWLASMAWCNRNESREGFIPASKLHGLVNVKNVKKTADDLVNRGAFDVAAEGFVIHDYAEYQQPDKVQQISAARSENGKKGAAARWQLPSRLPKQMPKQKDAPLSVDDDYQSSSSVVVANALAIHADRLAVGKDSPGAYAARIIERGGDHFVKLEGLLNLRPEATADELADAYRLGRWPATPRLPSDEPHPAACVCGGSGWVPADDANDRRGGSVVRCPETSWPDATIHQLRPA
jgi:hypothetical protein